MRQISKSLFCIYLWWSETEHTSNFILLHLCPTAPHLGHNKQFHGFVLHLGRTSKWAFELMAGVKHSPISKVLFMWTCTSISDGNEKQIKAGPGFKMIWIDYSTLIPKRLSDRLIRRLKIIYLKWVSEMYQDIKNDSELCLLHVSH